MTPTPSPPELSRLSLNRRNTNNWGAQEAVESCVRAGIPWIGLWRDKVAETGLEERANRARGGAASIEPVPGRYVPRRDRGGATVPP